MNFGKTIKEEILSKTPKDKNQKKAFLSGIIRGNGVLFQDDFGLGVEFSVNSEECAMIVASYLKSLFNYDLRELQVGEDKLNKMDKFTLTISGIEAEVILTELGILLLDKGEYVLNLKFYEELNDESSIRCFFRGLFLSIGNCTIPSENDSVNTGYHLELVFTHYTPALETSEKLAQAEVLTKITRRKEYFILYIKSAEEIKNLTAFLGAPKSVLALTEYMINRDISNNSNRQRNCDMGNLNRQAEAVQKQIRAIAKIEQTIGIDSLKDDLKSTAVARRENQEDSLIELAEKLEISKSCLNHRLRKIVQIAEEL